MAHDLDDFRDLVVLADHPAVLDKLVAHGCVHLRASFSLRARWVTAIQTSTAAAVSGAAGVSCSPSSRTDHTSVSRGCANCNRLAFGNADRCAAVAGTGEIEEGIRRLRRACGEVL